MEGLALVEALWARMCAGQREDGTEIEANDPVWDELRTAALAAKEHPHAWLEQSNIYGDLSQSKPFSDAFCKWLSMIWSHGCEEALIIYAGKTDIATVA